MGERDARGMGARYLRLCLRLRLRAARSALRRGEDVVAEAPP